jgi:hypothetical protein
MVCFGPCAHLHNSHKLFLTPIHARSKVTPCCHDNFMKRTSYSLCVIMMWRDSHVLFLWSFSSVNSSAKTWPEPHQPISIDSSQKEEVVLLCTYGVPIPVKKVTVNLGKLAGINIFCYKRGGSVLQLTDRHFTRQCFRWDILLKNTSFIS